MTRSLKKVENKFLFFCQNVSFDVGAEHFSRNSNIAIIHQTKKMVPRKMSDAAIGRPPKAQKLVDTASNTIPDIELPSLMKRAQ